MATKYPEIWAALAAPFDPGEVKARQAPGGRTLSYITARSAMNRLDSVLGPENWSDEYFETKDGLRCRITVTLPDGASVFKEDGGAGADMQNDDDSEKAAFSHAFKRAAAKFGIGRYLYQDGIPNYGIDAPELVPTVFPIHSPGGGHHSSPPSNASYNRPQTQQPHSGQNPANSSRPANAGGNASGNGGRQYGDPRNGRGLFAWTKDMEQRHDVGLLKYLNNWGKLQEFPSRMVDWSEDQVSLAVAEAKRKLQDVAGGESQVASPTANGERKDDIPFDSAPARPTDSAASLNSVDAARPAGASLSVAASREKLKRLVADIAQIRVGRQPNREDCFKVIADLDNMMPPGRIIPDINSCNDADLLADYFEAAMKVAGEAYDVASAAA